ncbi:enoyl-CoA hydratase [Mycolicibacterium diernhoferi]|uniref:Enoyl-CoA hydratase n=1 Tax=Mycolicibacterium diernhoferi TaxID=1801 RepID=A0A1Q4HFN2_9MYCO|nr:enoyl-CoA hydratase [Mycolicibacterium diernhoferi]OJZ66350.1 enoyl-CoA hydratase [Mycolicibacterium diernhoferi]OPE53429.1 enoyl-CoA hydratase [Mycolicibacterium diernhoferi]PEG54147.1 enoyl-CoA hydratase [Mycolicibacterium diernhoferi]QYL24517.1 enoyl-CoA hydratase [Mycolicibacterium diernhoferi]
MTVADSVGSEVVGNEAVRYEVSEAGVAVITLNRPERLNSWGADISSGVYAAFDRAEADAAVRAVVLTGTGKGFCAGAYMGAMQDLGESISGDTDVSKIVGERHPHFLTTLRKPVIAAINGACVGIGLTHALMCDVRFAAAGAKFATAFPRRGLIGEYGITWILPRLAGWGASADLLLSGRTFLAEEAAQLGLVKAVVPPEDLLPTALAYAEDLARNCSPASMAVIKSQLYGDAGDPVVDVSARAEKLMHESLVRPDLIEGISAFLEKRPPNFPPLQEL